MGDWHIIKPEEGPNLFIEPVSGLADPDTNWSITASPSGGDVVKATGKGLFGGTAYQFIMSTSTTLIFQMLGITVTAVPHTLSAYVETTNTANIKAVFDSSNNLDFQSVTHIRDDWYLFLYTATPTAGSRNFGVRFANSQEGYLGFIQLEAKAYHTTPTWGGKTPNIPKGYYWTGGPYLSISVRDSQERSGGRVIALSDYMNVQKASGWGIPDPTVSRDKPAQLDGTIYNNALYGERTMQFTGVVIPTTADAKPFSKRSPLVDLLRRDLVVPQQPFILRYTGGDIPLEAEFFYEGGLDGMFDAQQGNNDKVSFRLFSNDPYWYAIGNDAASLDIQDTLTTNYVIQRSRGGVWGNLATTLNGAVRAMAKDSNSNLWLGGDMTAPGTGAVKWNGSSLSAVAGLSASIYALLASGTDVYAAGANDTIAKSAAGGAFSALTVDLGANGPIYAVHTDGTTVWVGGEFTQIGGIAANNIAAFTITGATWATVGTGTNGAVYAIHKNGTNLYVGGKFSLAGGVANTKQIARRDLSGGSWNAMGTGVTAGSQYTVYGIDSDSSNNIYIVGNFYDNISGAVGGVANTSLIAKWNGSAWSSIGTFPLAQAFYVIEINGTDIYVGGPGAYHASVGLDSNLLFYNGSWARLTGGDVNGAVYALYHDGTDLWLGGAFSQAGAVADTARFCSHDGSGYSALGSGIDNGIVYSIAPYSTSIIAGGSFLNADGQADGDYIIEWDGAAFQVLSTGLTGTVRVMAVDGTDIYIGGAFADWFTLWDGAAFAALGTGSATLSASANIYALAKIGNILYFGGAFATVNSITANYIFSLDLVNNNSVSTLSTGMNGIVYALATDKSDNLYLGGAFTTAGGTTVNYVCKYSPATGTFSALASGLSGVVRALAFDNAGRLWAAGESGLLAYWNGSGWIVVDTDTTAALYTLAFDDDGNAYIGGAFEEIGGQVVDGAVVYDGSGFKLLDIDLPAAATVYAALNDANEITLGFSTAGATTTPGTTAVTNSGKALSFPVIEITGPGTVRQIRNSTTKKVIYFNNLELASGEIVTLDLSPFAKTLVSNSRGDISGKIIQSDEDTFALLAGVNSIKTFVTDPTATAVMTWRLAYEDLSGPSA